MTQVMGIVNVTPDSFSDGGKYFSPDEAVRRARNLIDEGASIIDFGGESTRPGATPISWEDEWARLEPVLRELFARDRYLKVEVAARVGYEASRHEGSAQERSSAALPVEQVGRNPTRKAHSGHQDAQPHEVLLKLFLLPYLDEIVTRLMQHRLANGKRRVEVEKLVCKLDHGARNGAGLG